MEEAVKDHDRKRKDACWKELVLRRLKLNPEKFSFRKTQVKFCRVIS